VRDAQADGGQVLRPQVVERARLVVGLGRDLEPQRGAIGLVAPSVAVAVDPAVQVQQRFGARRVVVAHLALERRVVAARARHQR
jgi:hypothetical protein